MTAWKCSLEGNQDHYSFPQNAGDTEDKGNSKCCVAQQAGQLRGLTDEDQGTQETQSQRQEQQEAQFRVISPNNGGASVTVEYKDHKAGAEDASEGNNHQNDSHSVTKGKEFHLFGDAGSLLSTGPELWQASDTLYGI